MRDLNVLSHLQERVYLHYVGLETDIIFNKGIHLPGFASYPLLETSNGRDVLRSYSEQILQIGREQKMRDYSRQCDMGCEQRPGRKDWLQP